MHQRQRHKDSCIAACIVMAEHVRGGNADEEALYAAGTTSLQWVARVCERTRSTTDFEELIFQLRAGHIAIATVRSDLWRDALARYPVASPHGRLVGDWHVVVIVQVSGETLHVRDPWFESEGQPIEVTADVFDACWVAQSVIFER